MSAPEATAAMDENDQRATRTIRSHPPISLNPLFRHAILGATHNRLVAKAVRRYGMRLGAGRFVAGETLDSCVGVLRELNGAGFRTNTTLLGEGVRDEATARLVVASYCEVLDRIASDQLDTNVALKLTHLGLDLDEAMTVRHLTALVSLAARSNNFIRVDMEESSRVEATLRVVRRLRAEGHTNVGTVLQSALYRTERDLDALLPSSPNLRLVKGAYLEPPSVAYASKTDVDSAYLRLAKRMVVDGGFTAIATHDEGIIERIIEFTDRERIGPDRFEFQMLYGVRPGLQRALVERGYPVRIATPYGPHWYFYLMRRLAERPANLLFLARILARR